MYDLDTKKDLVDLVLTALKEHEKKLDELILDFEKAFTTFCFCDWCYIYKKNLKKYEACGHIYTTGVCPQARFETIFKIERRFKRRT